MGDSSDSAESMPAQVQKPFPDSGTQEIAQLDERETPDLSNVKANDIELGDSSDSAESMPAQQVQKPLPDSGTQEIAQLDPAKVILEETMIPDDTSTRAPFEEENAPLDPSESVAAATTHGPEVAEPNSSPDNNNDGWGSSYAARRTTPAVPAPVPKPKDTPHSWISWTECYDDYCPDHYGTKNAIGKWPQKPWSRRRRQPAEDY